MEHGAWLPWLEKNEISWDIAKRLMRLHREYQIVQVALFDSVDAALKAIPKPQKEERSPTSRGRSPRRRSGCSSATNS